MCKVKLSLIPSIGYILKLYNIKALKSLSQNFLLSSKMCGRIVQSCREVKDCEVCEVGPGPGSITRKILEEHPKKLIVIEKDKRFDPVLQKLSTYVKDKFEIVYADILGYDLSNAFDESLKRKWTDKPPKVRIVGNLPFSVSTPLIIQWLKNVSYKDNAWSYGRVPMTLTFQEEVGRRMVAEPGSRERCRLSIMMQNWCNVTYDFTISGKIFVPPPKVQVAVMYIVPRVQPIIDLPFPLVEKVLRVFFNTRKKLCVKMAKNLFPESISNNLTDDLFNISKVSPKSRPFEMTLEDWKRICLAYKQIGDRDPRIFAYDCRGPKPTREKSWQHCPEELIINKERDLKFYENIFSFQPIRPIRC